MRWILALLMLLTTALLIMPLRFGRFYHGPKRYDLGLKVIPTLMAAGLAAWAAFGQANDRYALFLFAGLCACAAADVVLGICFAAGGVLFFLGHLCYMTAFISQQALGWPNLLVLAAALPSLWLFCCRYLPLLQNRLIALGIFTYSGALALLLCLSLPLPFLAFSTRTVFSATGTVLFVLSDMGVCHCMLVNRSKSFDFGVLGVYYLAQLCLALSAFGG